MKRISKAALDALMDGELEEIYRQYACAESAGCDYKGWIIGVTENALVDVRQNGAWISVNVFVPLDEVMDPCGQR